MLSMIPVGINIEDIQYVGSSAIDWLISYRLAR